MNKISQILQTTNRPQTRGAFVKWNDDGEPESYCALGALMCEANLVTFGHGMPGSSKLLETLGVPVEDMKSMRFTDRQCPDGDRCYRLYGDQPSEQIPKSKRASAYDMIVHLNDTHEWSFKQIGDWLATLKY